jgi:hypothetical protein
MSNAEAILDVWSLSLIHADGTKEPLGVFVDLAACRLAASKMTANGVKCKIDRLPVVLPETDLGFKEVGEKVYVDGDDFDRAMLKHIELERNARLGRIAMLQKTDADATVAIDAPQAQAQAQAAAPRARKPRKTATAEERIAAAHRAIKAARRVLKAQA